MKIGFIGAGRVGTALGGYLFKNGFKISGYYSRTYASADKAAAWSSSCPYTNIAELAVNSDIIGITTPDDAIETVADTLCGLSLDWNQKTVFHTSGVHASDIFAPLSEKGASVASLHPLLSFGEPNSAMEALYKTPFTFEGNGVNIDTLKQILNSCNNTWVEIETEQKVLYHASACVLSNYLVTLMDTGYMMLAQAGFTEEAARTMTEPLIRKTVDNVIKLGTKNALTGPISRGDTGTIEKHITKLRNYNSPWLEVYNLMGLQTIELAKKAGKISKSPEEKMKELMSGL